MDSRHIHRLADRANQSEYRRHLEDAVAEVVIIVCLPMIVALMALTFVIVMSSLGDVQAGPGAQRPRQ